jgi:hypothetical protein
MIMKTLLTILVICLASTALADGWVEIDAGDLPATAEIPTGADPFDWIEGNLGPSESDVDMYCIAISDPALFAATTCGNTSIDTKLMIFSTDTSLGLTYNDDDPGGCGLQSTVTGANLPGANQYWLAVCSYNNMPQDAAAQNLWLPSPFGVERVPDGPGAANPLAGWDGNGFTPGPYFIAMTGASFCGVVSTEERSWGAVKSLYR